MTPLDQQLSVSSTVIEAAKNFLKKKGNDFPESQGETCADLPQPRKHHHLLDRGNSRPKQYTWLICPLMHGLVQPRDEDNCHHRRRAQNVTWVPCTQEAPCTHSGTQRFSFTKLFRSKVLLNFCKHLQQILFSFCCSYLGDSWTPLFPGHCPDLPEHTAPGEHFCSEIWFDISPWHYQTGQRTSHGDSSCPGSLLGGEPTGHTVAGVTPFPSHDVGLI